jgi:KDO2-lipid IV(A) lauroyltransferase
MSNVYLENYTKWRRGRFGVDMVSIYQGMRYLVAKKSRPTAYFLVADQYPTTKEKQKMVHFFGATTGFLHGPEDFSRQKGAPVFYLEMKRLKRGHYSMKFYPITENAKDLPANELTQRYASLLEESIRKQPEDWMWSHKRWKKELYSFD